MVLRLYLCHENSEYVLGFEIGEWEDGLYSEQTDTPSTVLVYRYSMNVVSAIRNEEK